MQPERHARPRKAAADGWARASSRPARPA